MNPNNETPSFFNSQTIIAIIAVIVVFYGWQTYLTKKYPNYGQKAAVVAQAETAKTADATVGTPAAELKQNTIKSAESKTYNFNSDKISFSLTSHGMGLQNLVLNNYTDKNDQKIRLGESDKYSLFEMQMVATNSAIDFDVTESAPGHYIGLAKIGDSTIKRELVYDDQQGAFKNTVTISKVSADLAKGVSFVLPETIRAAASKSFLFPSYEHQDFVVINNGGSSTTVNFSGSKEDLNKDFNLTTIIGMGSQYFAAAFLDKSEILPDLKIKSSVQEKTALGLISYKPALDKDETTINQILYAGPKSIDTLKNIDPELPRIIDFGFFGMISRPLVSVMKFFYSIIGNWGLAIILLTLLVRLTVLPFNIMSMRSMKAMQKIQPRLQSLREKYKDDPMVLNRETMALMKENGANPLGGCLPMLIQIPVFFALYRVIGSSIELYHSPFFGWITDLSSHDKFYVLPVIMGGAMFFQQKLTPSTMDPTQAKIMMFLPVVFSVFMLQLPSGLSLYMCVSTIFGVTQQYLIMRDKTRQA